MYLAQIFIEGNVHWLTILLDEEPELTWERLKEELMSRYSEQQAQNCNEAK